MPASLTLHACAWWQGAKFDSAFTALARVALSLAPLGSLSLTGHWRNGIRDALPTRLLAPTVPILLGYATRHLALFPGEVMLAWAAAAPLAMAAGRRCARALSVVSTAWSGA